MNLLPFTDGDWDAFSGCESENPLVAYPDTETAVVLDGIVVQVFKTLTDGTIATYGARLRDEDAARLTAEVLASDPTNLEAFGLERI